MFDKLDDDDDGEIGARALSCALQVRARRLLMDSGCPLCQIGMLYQSETLPSIQMKEELSRSKYALVWQGGCESDGRADAHG